MGSASIPTEVKNRVTNNVLIDPISDRICVAKGDSASSIPARNAPREGDRPSAWADQIDPSAMFYTELEVMDELLRKAERPSD